MKNSSAVSGAAGSVASKYGKTDSEKIAAWCTYMGKAVAALKWDLPPCPPGIKWQVGGESVQGRPLVFAEFGDQKSANTTLVLSMVHGDEITPLHLGLKLAHWLKDHQSELPGVKVVIAPMVNPDGFFARPRTRVNARGVDINRNFTTQDWSKEAQRAWKTKFRSDPRRFPGASSNSEVETLFQVKLIKESVAQKILTIHSPLNHMDYDGPNQLTLARFPAEYVKECLKLRQRVKAISSGFFPGSLGNYAGQELGIPTLTLELPTADPSKAEAYWKLFTPGIRTMIEFKVPELQAFSRVQSSSASPE